MRRISTRLGRRSKGIKRQPARIGRILRQPGARTRLRLRGIERLTALDDLLDGAHFIRDRVKYIERIAVPLQKLLKRLMRAGGAGRVLVRAVKMVYKLRNRIRQTHGLTVDVGLECRGLGRFNIVLGRQD